MCNKHFCNQHDIYCNVRVLYIYRHFTPFYTVTLQYELLILNTNNPPSPLIVVSVVITWYVPYSESTAIILDSIMLIFGISFFCLINSKTVAITRKGEFEGISEKIKERSQGNINFTLKT